MAAGRPSASRQIGRYQLTYQLPYQFTSVDPNERLTPLLSVTE
jgi:hypothetical protein